MAQGKTLLREVLPALSTNASGRQTLSFALKKSGWKHPGENSQDELGFAR
jgi:hypothetical protein